jgi:hypothetical protein
MAARTLASASILRVSGETLLREIPAWASGLSWKNFQIP